MKSINSNGKLHESHAGVAARYILNTNGKHFTSIPAIDSRKSVALIPKNIVKDGIKAFEEMLLRIKSSLTSLDPKEREKGSSEMSRLKIDPMQFSARFKAIWIENMLQTSKPNYEHLNNILAGLNIKDFQTPQEAMESFCSLASILTNCLLNSTAPSTKAILIKMLEKVLKDLNSMKTPISPRGVDLLEIFRELLKVVPHLEPFITPLLKNFWGTSKTKSSKCLFRVDVEPRLEESNDDIHTVDILCTVNGIQRTVTSSQPPLALSLVVDVSGSMDGKKFENCKKTMKDLIQRLNPSDQLCIVTFSTTAKVPLHFLHMTNSNKKFALDIVDSLKTESGTNMYAGLTAAFKECPQGQVVVDMLLLSDGYCDDHEGGRKLLKELKNNLLFSHPEVYVSSFAYGNLADGMLLAAVAKIGRGQYYYVAKPDDIAQSIKRWHLDRTEVVYRARCVVSVSNGVSLSVIDQGITADPISSVSYIVDFGLIFSGSVRTILLQAHFPAQSKFEEITINFDNENYVCILTDLSANSSALKDDNPPLDYDVANGFITSSSLSLRARKAHLRSKLIMLIDAILIQVKIGRDSIESVCSETGLDPSDILRIAGSVDIKGLEEEMKNLLVATDYYSREMWNVLNFSKSVLQTGLNTQELHAKSRYFAQERNNFDD